MNIDRILRQHDKRLKGEMGVWIEDLRNGRTWGLREDEVFSTASVIKLQILAVLCERAKAKELSLDDRMPLLRRHFVQGSGLIKHMRPGDELSLHNLAVLMISISDNTATNMLIGLLGVKRINAQLRAWGFEKTTLHRKITFDKVDSAKCEWLAGSTPRETGEMLSRISRRELLGKKWDGVIEEVLLTLKSDAGLHRMLPGAGDLDDEDREQITLAGKTGAVDGVRNEAGIVIAPFGRYVISLFTRNLADNRYHPDNEGRLAAARLNASVYEALREAD